MSVLTSALKPIVVLVEGISDKYLLARLIETRKLPEVSIITCKGQPHLEAQLSQLEKRLQGIADSSNAAQVNRVAIVFDMENAASDVNNYIHNCLNNKPISAPYSVCLVGDKDTQQGCFETLCLQAIRPEDPALACAVALLNCAKMTNEKTEFNRAQQDKVTLQAYTVARKELRGNAHEVLDFKHACFDELAQFIQSLHI